MKPGERAVAVRALFDRLAGHTPAERARLLRQAIKEGADAAIVEEVRRMLEFIPPLDAFDGPATAPAAPPARAGPAAAPAAGSQATTEGTESLAAPRDIGPYRIMQRLGEGGFGVVYLAEQLTPVRRRVALKVLKAGMDSEAVLARFSMERQVLGTLSHPNIAQLFDAGLTPEGRPYFAMEYVEGMTIDRHCDAQEHSVRERLELFLKVCSAVQHAHQNLVIHRDIKPGNILVTTDGQPKLLDFGIAKILNPGIAGAAATAPEMRVLTPEYASPEQALGQPVTVASDVYSLGVVLYELLTGHPPYATHSRVYEDVLKLVTDTEPARPSLAAGQDVDEPGEGGAVRMRPATEIARRRGTGPRKLQRLLQGDLDNIVLMAMRKTPRRRYVSVQQFAEDIQRHMNGRPVIARPETFSYLGGKFVLRHRAGVTAAAVVLAVLVVAVGVLAVQARALERANKELSSANAGLNRRDLRTREIVNNYLEDLYSDVRRVPGASAATRLLVETALSMLKRLEDEVSESPALKAELARAYKLVGDAQDLEDVRPQGGGARDEELEATQAAERAYAKAAELYKALVGDDPSLLASLAAAQAAQARTVQYLQDTARAEAIFREARSTAQRAAEHSDDPQTLHVLAETHEGMGTILAWRRKNDEAWAEFEAALQTRNAIISDGRADLAQAYSERASVRLRMAEFCDGTGEFEDAASHAERALNDLRESWELRQRPAGGPASDVFHQRAVMRAHHRLGLALMNGASLGGEGAEARLARALTELHAALDAAARIHADDPVSLLALQELAQAHEAVGDALVRTGDFEQALHHLQEFGRLADRLAETDSGRSALLRPVAAEKRGTVLHQLKDYRAAAGAYAEAERAFAALHDRDPDNVQAEFGRVRCLTFAGRALAHVNGEEFDAVDPLERAAAAYEVLARRANLDLVDLCACLDAFYYLALVYEALDKAGDSRAGTLPTPWETAQRGLDLAARHPDAESTQRPARLRRVIEKAAPTEPPG